MTRAAAALLFTAAAISQASAEPPLPSGLFRIGGTNIRCVQAPCPTVGIVKLGPDGRPGWPIYSGARPPRIEGDAAAREAVERNWTLQGCVEVEGAFLQPATFEVRRVVGPCGRR
ncbi:hypothetical protein [Methylopila sp. M107]|uniref:hypothetical protein n=1 Tax=Methylopila sp. M107 TaxID=1101190 RepID=UPI0012DD8E9C|nr:hypothetical protein [Methylopila sp. M107]